MALYIPASRRRRRTLIIAGLAAVAGLVVGLAIGRLSSPSVADTVRSKQRAVEDIVARLDGLGLEYQQTGGGAAATVDARQGSIDAAQAIARDTSALVADLPWVPASERSAVLDAAHHVQTDVEQAVPAADLAAAIDQAEAVLRAAAGLGPST
jgi:hypothetical protein